MTLLSTYNKVALCCEPVWETLITTLSSEMNYIEHISTQNNIDVERVQKEIAYWDKQNNNVPALLENHSEVIVRVTGHKTPGESSVILQIVVMIQLTSRRILRD